MTEDDAKSELRQLLWDDFPYHFAHRGGGLVVRRARLKRKHGHDGGFEAAWRAEVWRFIEEVVLPGLGYSDPKYTGIDDELFERIDGFVVQGGAFRYRKNMSGSSYETACGVQLLCHGWEIMRSPAADPGIYCLVERDGVRGLIRFKKVKNPVEASVVKQVIAERSRIGMSHACIMSDAGYSPVAREVADSAEVRLLHHDDLGGPLFRSES